MGFFSRAEQAVILMVVAVLILAGGAVFLRGGMASGPPFTADTGARAGGGVGWREPGEETGSGKSAPEPAATVVGEAPGTMSGTLPGELPGIWPAGMESRKGSEEGIVVHVAGAVLAPGVYRLGSGSRVIDAIRAAGGENGDAAVDCLNLAAPVNDGERVYVPTRKEIQGPNAGTTSSFPLAGGNGPGGRINVNTAGERTLEGLPGIGPVLARRIVEYRQMHGPFRRVEDLLRVAGIGERKLAQIRPLITVQ